MKSDEFSKNFMKKKKFKRKNFQISVSEEIKNKSEGLAGLDIS